jgi:hypothetical protein
MYFKYIKAGLYLARGAFEFSLFYSNRKPILRSKKRKEDVT